ncbi:four-carbon acid sugar kinase family protein [Ornithinibacillus massiliensis]|uniref:Four-carbon acid sugar kinase family protein n=1 Tax=Ornithinibacillus massiliensis TaxID=1944633 RepID=A0ABS5M9Y5_9BACI|nr:four-carbon acid sugar kinase family protein [Ornithinibacillus massiliensis]MBS3679124.1 four-carbon acid sugar kinase family protein [Ornithinibacillus massiliensis]
MKVGVVADDLTGANATGVKLSKQGFTAATVVFNDEIPEMDELDAVCIDTDSRYASDRIVINRVKNATEKFRTWGAQVICKRIDSTVRGKIGLEIDTILDEVGDDSVAVVVPSFPDSGRVCSGGYLLVNGAPVQETDVAKDPVMPIKQSYVPAIIEEQSKFEVAHIGLDTVLTDSAKIKAAFDSHIQDGKRIIVVDAVTDEDIEEIAEAMVQIQGVHLIPTDPGPLTASYARAYSHQHVEQSKVIVTVGSVTSLTGQQLHYLKDKTNSTPVYVAAEKLATMQDSWEVEVDRAVKEALERIHQDDVLIITTHKEQNDLIDFQSIAAKENATQDALAKRITDGLAKITRLVMEQTNYAIQGCFTSGGDVTASLCALSMASGIKLEDEVLPLAAYGTLIGGHFPGLPIVTKGGMVGDKKSIFACVKYLKTKRSAAR